MSDGERPGGRSTEKPTMAGKLVWGLGLLCALLFGADAFYARHGQFAIEDGFGFFAIFGFVACAAAVLAARGVRRHLQRREDFYDRDD
ncbi:MAG: hypothetical protein ACFCUO_04650 [Rhodospirillales bacterium]